MSALFQTINSDKERVEFDRWFIGLSLIEAKDFVNKMFPNYRDLYPSYSEMIFFQAVSPAWMGIDLMELKNKYLKNNVNFAKDPDGWVKAEIKVLLAK